MGISSPTQALPIEEERAPLWRRILSFKTTLCVMLATSPFFASLDVQRGGPFMRDPDIWWHMRNAQVLLSTHHFIRHDLYSFTTAGQPWIDPEWLSEIPYYLAFRFFSERGLFLMALLLVELFIAGMMLRCRLRSRDFTSSFFATWIAVIMAAINIGPRTILCGWLCFLVELFLLEDFRHGRDRLWLMVPLFVLWINFHGSWLIGFVFFAIFMASGLLDGNWGSIEAVRWTPAQLRKLFLVGSASIAALFINPYGWRLVAYPFNMLVHQRLNLAMVDEWRGPDFLGFYGMLVFVLCTAILLFTLARRRAWPLHELLFMLLALYMGLAHKRFLFLTGIIICPILAFELSGAVFSPYDPSKDNKWILNLGIMAAFLTFAITHVPSSSVLHAAESHYFPVNALPRLQSRCRDAHTLNRYEWGGFLIWNDRQNPVFLDSRTDIFEFHGVFASYLMATSLHNPAAILNHYQIGCVLLEPQSPLVTFLQHQPGWHTQYQDNTAALMVRTPAAAGD